MAARGSDRDDLAGLSIRMFSPQLHTSHGDFRAAGQTGVDDPLTIIDTVPADRCNLRRCGTGLGQPLRYPSDEGRGAVDDSRQVAPGLLLSRNLPEKAA